MVQQLPDGTSHASVCVVVGDNTLAIRHLGKPDSINLFDTRLQSVSLLNQRLDQSTAMVGLVGVVDRLWRTSRAIPRRIDTGI